MQWLNRSRVELHIIALFTPHTCSVLSCWVRHMQGMMDGDVRENLTYTLHVGWRALDQRGNGSATTAGAAYRDALWMQAVRAKVDHLWGLLRRHAARPGNHIYLLTDLDVLPLAGYSRLTTMMLDAEATANASGAPSPEIFFLREPPQKGACGPGAPVANSGLMLMRNTFSVRQLWWYVSAALNVQRHRARMHMHDQDVLNALLLHRLRPTDLSCDATGFSNPLPDPFISQFCSATCPCCKLRPPVWQVFSAA